MVTTTDGSTTTSSTEWKQAPEFVEGECQFEVPRGRTVDCGTIEVHAYPDDPGSPVIELAVAVFRSASDSPAPDPVVYLEGGPGGDALELIPLVFERGFAHLLEDRDVIFFDQRGTGYSTPSLACPEVRELGLEMLDDVLDPDQQVSMLIEELSRCRDRLEREGAVLDAYSSVASASDLEDLRRALGYEEWNLYGISYGTRLALTTMRTQPEGLRSVILDSVYSPDDDLYIEAPTNLNRSLNELFEGCSSDEACAAEYPDLEQTFYDTVAALNRDPVRAPVTDVFTGQVYDAVFDGAAFGGIVFQSLYSEEIIPILPRLIDDVSQGELYDLGLLATTFLANGEFFSLGMQFSVQCHEEVPFSSPERTAAALDEYPQLEPIFASSLNTGVNVFAVCDMWGAGSADPIENETVMSPVPTLILTGEYDPITPPRWGREVADSLESSVLVELPGVGHGASASVECPQQLVRAFLNDPTGDVDTSCVDEMGPPEFLVGEALIGEITLVPFTEEFVSISLSGVFPDGWTEQAQGAWARGATGLDQTFLIQQAAPIVNAQGLLNLLSTQFGLEAPPPVAGTHSSPAAEFTLYETLVAGVPAVIALADIDGGAILVMLAAAPSEFGPLQEAVLFPALDALSVN